MHFTDIFIKRPVLASVVSLIILLLGTRSLLLMNIREYPETSNTVITVATPYVGANAELVMGFITTPLERAIASADGIDFITSSSSQGLSYIQAHLDLDYDPYKALTQITAKVNKVRNELPRDSEDPIIDVTVGDRIASMYISFSSDVLQPNQITDYLSRVVQPQLQAVSGIQKAEILGARTFAMRIWLKPDKMAALGITPADIRAKLAQNNFLSAVGKTKGSMISVNLTAATDLQTEQQFRDMVVKSHDTGLVRLADVADIVLGAEDYDTRVTFDGQAATFMGISVLPTANVLTVIADIREILPEIAAQLPEGLHMAVPYDATKYISDAIFRVQRTLLEAL